MDCLFHLGRIVATITGTYSTRFGRPVIITRHAAERMAGRAVSDALLLRMIDEGDIRYRDDVPPEFWPACAPPLLLTSPGPRSDAQKPVILSPLSPVQTAMGGNLFAQRVGFATDSAPELALPDADNSMGPAGSGSQ